MAILVGNHRDYLLELGPELKSAEFRGGKINTACGPVYVGSLYLPPNKGRKRELAEICLKTIAPSLASVCCEVCYGLSDSIEHRHKILPCGYTFCLACLLKVESRDCPYCRKVRFVGL